MPLNPGRQVPSSNQKLKTGLKKYLFFFHKKKKKDPAFISIVFHSYAINLIGLIENKKIMDYLHYHNFKAFQCHTSDRVNNTKYQLEEAPHMDFAQA